MTRLCGCFLLTLKWHVLTKPDDKKGLLIIGFVNMPYHQLISKKAFGWRLTCTTHSQKTKQNPSVWRKKPNVWPLHTASSCRGGISDHIQFRILPYELAHADMMGIGPIPPITKTPQVLTLDTWNAVIFENFVLGDGCDVYSVLQWKSEIVYV